MDGSGSSAAAAERAAIQQHTDSTGILSPISVDDDGIFFWCIGMEASDMFLFLDGRESGRVRDLGMEWMDGWDGRMDGWMDEMESDARVR